MLLRISTTEDFGVMLRALAEAVNGFVDQLAIETETSSSASAANNQCQCNGALTKSESLYLEFRL
jgi:hypothetical protein